MATRRPAASSAAPSAAAPSTLSDDSQRKGKALKQRTSWTRALCVWGCILPLITLVLVCAIPLLWRSVEAHTHACAKSRERGRGLIVLSCVPLSCVCSYQSLPAGRPFSLMVNQTVFDQPSNYHSRYRGPEYLDQYDRFFFQWWNFLIYDAETHDHWTLVYHTTKYSKAANYSDYASCSMIHKQRSTTRDSAHDAVPLKDLIHERDWDLGLRKADGTVPYRMTIIDDNTYNIVANYPAGTPKTSHGKALRWNLTFHRRHGMYNGLDTEQSNKDACMVVSTLFGYHSTVSGWIEEGEGESAVRRVFSNEGAAGDRYRAYAAGSWGCKLPSGSPAISYPWTWFWLVIPANPKASPPTPEIGMAMGTARFQLNVSAALGDLFGGFASVGIGAEEIVTSSFGTLRHGDPLGLELPLSKASTDSYLRRYDLGYERWTQTSDETGPFEVPLVQTYDVETRRYKFQLRFESEAEQYFRCPVVLEREVSAAQSAAAQSGSAQSAVRRLQVFSDYRAVGVKTRVQIWRRSHTPEEVAALKKSAGAAAAVVKSVPAPRGANVTLWSEGGWQEIIYDGWVDTMNALEYAYESPLPEDVYQKYVAPQKFD